MTKGVNWTREEDKLFEAALVSFADEEEPERWRRIAGKVPGKSPEEIRGHYEELVEDVMLIESGRVELPDYPEEACSSSSSWGSSRKHKQGDAERKKGTPWTEDEHRLFLLGLEKYGKGDWRSISRNMVVTRTPTQVASHAQKYYLRQSSGKKERKRTSIHDITSAGDTSAAIPVDQSWIPPPSGSLLLDQPPTLQPLASQVPFNSNLSGSLGYQSFRYPM